MIRIVQDPRTGIYYRVAVDPMTGRTRVLGPALESQVEPGATAAMAEYLQTTLPDADIAGFRGPGVVPGGEQSRGNRRAREIEDTVVVPTSYWPLAGAQLINRGGSRVVPLGGAAGAPEIGLIDTLVETPRPNGDDARSIRVTCGYDIEGVDPAALIAEVVSITGRLSWGAGGILHTLEFDFMQGLSFSVLASYVRVGASVGRIITADERRLSVKATLGYGEGTPAMSSPLRRTVLIGTIAIGATSATFPIPRFATAMTLALNGLPAAGLDIDLFSSVPTVISTHYRYTGQTNADHQRDGQYAIPATARYFSIGNVGGATAATSVQAVFTLSA